MMAMNDPLGQGGAEPKATGPLGRAQEGAMDAGRQAAGATQNRIRMAFEQQSHRAADQIDNVAQALHSAAQRLDTENNGTAAHYTGMAAHRVEQLADTLRHSNIDDLVARVESYARRQPELFLGGAFGLGFLFSRFVKSSSDRTRLADLKHHPAATPYATDARPIAGAKTQEFKTPESKNQESKPQEFKHREFKPQESKL